MTLEKNTSIITYLMITKKILMIANQTISVCFLIDLNTYELLSSILYIYTHINKMYVAYVYI